MLLPSMFGYIDPVSGSIVLQVIVGGLVGGFVVFRNVIDSAVC